MNILLCIALWVTALFSGTVINNNTQLYVIHTNSNFNPRKFSTFV